MLGHHSHGQKGKILKNKIKINKIKNLEKPLGFLLGVLAQVLNQLLK